MFRNLFGVDWRKSPAHLKFLAKFLEPTESSAISNPDGWKAVLNEDLQKAIKRFLSEGMLVEADLAGKLDARFKAVELKAMLKQRSLPVSGTKDEMIQRLLEKDRRHMEELVKEIDVLICSADGRRIAEQYRAEEDAKRKAAESQVWQLLQSRKFRAACETMAAFEAKQVFPRGMGIDWQHYKPDHDEQMLHCIFNDTPKILRKVPHEKLDPLRMAAAMSHLWGTSRVKQWLPPGFTTDTKMDVEAEARMFAFRAHIVTALADLKSSNVVQQVQVISASDCCPDCKRINGKKFKLNDAIELPYEHCTHPMGCRCQWIAVVR